MVANASAHRHRVYVGSSLENWSRALVSFDAGQDLRNDRGILPVTGTIELLEVLGNPGSLNPRTQDGRSRWWRGQRIMIETSDSSGNYVRDRFGHLYILKAPQPPQNGVLSLEVGCILSLRNFVQPDEDASGIVYPTDGSLPPLIDRRTIVNNLLAAAGCPACVDAIPLYPIQTPQPKQGGSFVEQAGLIAYGGLMSLYQDNQGQIRAVSNELIPQTPDLVLQIGRDEITYETSEGSETPCEIIKCVGVVTELVSNYGTETTTEEEYGPASSVDPAAGDGTITIKRSRITETVNAFGRERFEISEAPGGIVAPNAYGKSLSMILDSRTWENHDYEAGRAGKLQRVTTQTDRLFPATAPEYFEGVGIATKNRLRNRVIRASFQILRYRYTPDELVRETTRTLNEPACVVAPDELFDEPGITPPDRAVGLLPESLVTSEIETIGYVRKNPRIGRKEERLRQAIGKGFANLESQDPNPLNRIRQKLAVLQRRFRRLFSTTGQANPPQAERKIEPFTEEEKPIEGKATFQLAPEVIANQERERTIQLDAGVVSEAQLSQLAMIRGLEIIGSAQGQTFQVPLYDLFLNTQRPFLWIKAIEPDGTELLFLAHGIQISHDPDRAIAGFTGIWLGQISHADRIEPPYSAIESPEELVIPEPSVTTVQLRGGIRIGGAIVEKPYGFTTETIQLQGGGMRIGGFVTEELALGARIGGAIDDGTGGDRFSETVVSLQGTAGMTQLFDGGEFGTYGVAVNLGNIGFSFPLYVATYQNNLYVDSNSRVTFGYEAANNSDSWIESPGKSLQIDAQYRPLQAVWVLAGSDRVRIRAEFVIAGEGDTNDLTAWEVTLFDDGAIMLVIGQADDTTALLTKGDGIDYTQKSPVSEVELLDENGWGTGIYEPTSVVFRPSGATYTVQTGSYD